MENDFNSQMQWCQGFYWYLDVVWTNTPLIMDDYEIMEFKDNKNNIQYLWWIRLD